MLGDPSVLSGCKSTFMEFIKNSAALGCCLWTPPPQPPFSRPNCPKQPEGSQNQNHFPRPVRSWSCLSGGVACILDRSLQTHWLAETEPLAGLFVLVHSALFGFLSCPRGWGHSARTSLCLPHCRAPLCARRGRQGPQTVSTGPWPPLDSGCGRPRGPEDRRGTLMSVLPAAPARLGSTAEATAPRGSRFLQPDPRGRPLPISHLWEPACCWHLRASPALMTPSNLATPLQTVLSLNLFWAHLCLPTSKFINEYPKAQPL